VAASGDSPRWAVQMAGGLVRRKRLRRAWASMSPRPGLCAGSGRVGSGGLRVASEGLVCCGRVTCWLFAMGGHGSCW